MTDDMMITRLLFLSLTICKFSHASCTFDDSWTLVVLVVDLNTSNDDDKY